MSSRHGQLVKLASGSWAVLREVNVPGAVGGKLLVAVELEPALQQRFDAPTSTETELPADFEPQAPAAP